MYPSTTKTLIYVSFPHIWRLGPPLPFVHSPIHQSVYLEPRRTVEKGKEKHHPLVNIIMNHIYTLLKGPIVMYTTPTKM